MSNHHQHQHHDENRDSDVSNADVTLFKNNQGARPPSSEVGLEQRPIQTTSSSAWSPADQPGTVTAQRMEPIPIPTTSLGYPSQTHHEMIHAPGRNPPIGVPPQFFMQMMDTMQKMSERLCAPSADSKIRIKDVYLPSFDPDTNVGIREWCQHIDKAVEQYKLNDFDVRMKVCSLLRGRAKMWVDDWMVTASSWEELRSNLITTFEPENRYSRDILRFREHVYDSTKDIAEFLSRDWVLCKRVTKDNLDNGHFYISLDMAAGFHQIPIAEGSIEKTAFVTPDGLYEYLTMPFGLSNACSVYQRCINRALCPLLGSVAQAYVDDVLSKCTEFAEGLSNLERILMALQQAGFSINADKCSFFKRSIEYLGNIVSDGQVQPSPRKVEALVKAPVPKTVKQVRQFNGLASYFRKYIPNFSRIMVPLYELTKQGAKWEWDEKHENARSTIIQCLTSTPVLTLFQEAAPTQLATDASSLGFGAVLVQRRRSRRCRKSRKLTGLTK